MPVHELLAGRYKYHQEQDQDTLPIIDPVGGLTDLEQQRVRVVGKKSFSDDPLRMLRVFRFAAVLDFTVEPETLEQIQQLHETLGRVAKERIAYELDLIMVSPRAHQIFSAMRNCSLLWEILPELQAGQGMEQPASHHLDVFGHCLEALRQMELVLADLEHYFSETFPVMEKYLETGQRKVQMKWAALLHDVGKIREYSSGVNLKITNRGRLLGHITMGYGWVLEKIKEVKGFPLDLSDRLLHIILSHHGHLEYGSPKRPKILEAFIVYHADHLDGDIGGFNIILENTSNENDWSDYVRNFERPVYIRQLDLAEEADRGNAGKGNPKTLDKKETEDSQDQDGLF